MTSKEATMTTTKDGGADLHEWKTVSSMGSSYKKFDELHGDDYNKLKTANDTGNLDDIMLINTSTGWTKTLNKGVEELKNAPTTLKNEIIVDETIKDLNSSLDMLNKITPQGDKPKSTTSSSSYFDFIDSIKNYMYGVKKPQHSTSTTTCTVDCQLPEDNRYTIKELVNVINDENREQFKCCVKTLFLDDTFTNPDIKTTISYLESVVNLIIYYNTRAEFIVNNMLEKSRKQITCLELLPRQIDDGSRYVPFEAMSIFPALVSMKGLYTSNFNYMFKYITDATLWLPTSNQVGYFENNEQRIIQFLDLPNIKNLILHKKLASDDTTASVYNLHVNNTPQLEIFEDSFDIVYDSVRIYNAPKLKHLQNKLHANKIDMKNLRTVDALDLTVNKSLILTNFARLKSLHITLNEPNVSVKVLGVPKLETLTVNGDLNFQNGNRHIVLDCSTMNNLCTFIVEGKLVGAPAKIIDNFMYEIIKNNKNLTHININGISITGKNLYEQYKTSFEPPNEPEDSDDD